jgi:hypothetical protein
VNTRVYDGTATAVHGFDVAVGIVGVLAAVAVGGPWAKTPHGQLQTGRSAYPLIGKG